MTPTPAVSPLDESGSRQAGHGAGPRKEDMDNREQDERHPLHWQTACIAVGVWIVAGALVALAWGVLR